VKVVRGFHTLLVEAQSKWFTKVISKVPVGINRLRVVCFFSLYLKVMGCWREKRMQVYLRLVSDSC